MIWRNHVACSIILSLPLGYLLFTTGTATPLQIGLALAGLLVGCLMPDADLQDSKIFHTAAAPLALFTRWVILLPTSVILLLFGKDDPFSHRSLLHSFLGMIITEGIYFGVLYAITRHAYLAYSLPLLAGLALGWMLHLVEDSVTKTGVRPLYPLEWNLSGKISTGKFTLLLWRTEWAALAWGAVLAAGQVLLVRSLPGVALSFWIAAWLASLIIFRLPFASFSKADA